MKHFVYYLVLLSFLFIWSCNESSVSVFNVVLEEYKAEKKDSLMINVDQSGAVIELKGTVEIIDGECHFWLRNPDNDTIYTEVFSSPGRKKVSQEFLRLEGEWVFIYQIKRIEDVTPSGSIDLQIRYKN